MMDKAHGYSKASTIRNYIEIYGKHKVREAASAKLNSSNVLWTVRLLLLYSPAIIFLRAKYADADVFHMLF